MRIVINHLTRMKPGYICAAGIELSSRTHIRPVIDGQLSDQLLRCHGGPFNNGAIVDLGKTHHVGVKPEIEDHIFDPKSATFKEYIEGEVLWDILSEQSKPTLVEIFGSAIKLVGTRYCGTDQGEGRASLGVLRPTLQPTLELRDKLGSKQIRLLLMDKPFEVDLMVTDIRCYLPDHRTPDEATVAKIQKRLQSGEEVLLSVGLTRPKALAHYPSTHWLQVNGIHFHTKPGWRLAER